MADGERSDHGAVDWPRVARAVYQVRQHYRYSYTGPVSDLKQRLMMVPPDRHRDQRLLGRGLDVRGTEEGRVVSWEQDAWGNRVCRVRADRVERAVDFEASYRVERFAPERAAASQPADASDATSSGYRAARAGSPISSAPPADPTPCELTPPWAGSASRIPSAYLQPTALTAPDARLEAVARDLSRGGTNPRARAELAGEWAAGAIAYQHGVTGVQTPAAMALHLGKGVCQDYAHILLCILRLLGVPARYVSGHLLGEGAPHAWVEALLADPMRSEGVEVLAYDPTHRRRAGLSYITVAVGRDYADIAPTSGVYSGPAAGRLSSSKQAEIVELAYTDGDESREDAA